MEQEERVGLENVLGKKVIDDPRVKEIEKEIRSAVEKYEAMLVVIAIEQGIVHPQ